MQRVCSMLAVACLVAPWAAGQAITLGVEGSGDANLQNVTFNSDVSTTSPILNSSAVALIWIAVKLLAPPRHDEEDTPEAVEDLWRAVRIVVIADIVMSLDNVIAIAAIAKGQYVQIGRAHV